MVLDHEVDELGWHNHGFDDGFVSNSLKDFGGFHGCCDHVVVGQVLGNSHAVSKLSVDLEDDFDLTVFEQGGVMGGPGLAGGCALES